MYVQVEIKWNEEELFLSPGDSWESDDIELECV
jgi:hypothetical protein